jgi:hypothetical protein
MKIRLFFDDGDGDACRKTAPHRQLCHGASLPAFW